MLCYIWRMTCQRMIGLDRVTKSIEGVTFIDACADVERYHSVRAKTIDSRKMPTGRDKSAKFKQHHTKFIITRHYHSSSTSLSKSQS